MASLDILRKKEKEDSKTSDQRKEDLGKKDSDEEDKGDETSSFEIVSDNKIKRGRSKPTRIQVQRENDRI